jgi:hypothetical protein
MSGCGGKIYHFTFSPVQLHLVVHVVRQWQLKPPWTAMRGLLRRLTDFLAEHGSVVPREAQFGVRGISPQYPQGFRPTCVVVEENVSLSTFHQRQNIDVLLHGLRLLLRL